MRGLSRHIAIVVTAMIAVAPIARAQGAQGADPLARALASYRDLEYDAAAAQLRSLLAPGSAARLSVADRSRALVYLGATELFRNRRDAAVEAFRTLLLADPAYRPDEVVFPPEVSALYHETRLGVRAVAVVVPPEVVIEGAFDRFQIRMFATSLHSVRVQVTDAFGAVGRTLFDGVVGDSLELLWNARDGIGRLRDPGRYLLRVTSRSALGREERRVEIPLDVERVMTDTLPEPAPLAPSIFRPESEVRSSGMQPLATGLLGAAFVAGLPSIVGGSTSGMSMRFGVAGVLGVAGIIGVARASRPVPLPANATWNRQQREAWQRELDRVRAENETRRGTARLRIRAGKPTTTELK